MMRPLSSAVLGGALLVSGLALAGCGQAGEPETATDPVGSSSSAVPSGEAASGDTPTSEGPSQMSDLPQWPATCQSRSVVSVDYGRMPPGYGTPEEAVQHATAAGIPDGTPVLAPADLTGGKGPAQVWVVDPQSGEILAQVSVFRGPDGWFVDGVMTCS
jgi:hypothetical protein